MDRRLFFLGAALGAVAVLLGAFGAHSLELDAAGAQTFRTAVLYHLVHSLAIIAAGCAARFWPGWRIRAAGTLFAVGVGLFSGSLYLLVLTDIRWLGAVTAPGGLAFVAGWVLMAWAAYAAR